MCCAWWDLVPHRRVWPGVFAGLWIRGVGPVFGLCETFGMLSTVRWCGPAVSACATTLPDRGEQLA